MKKTKKICCISDLHGNLGLDVPECDILLIAGDICPFGREIYKDANWLEYKFSKWLKRQKAKNIVITPGNHDIIFQNHITFVPKLECDILIDKQIKIDKLNVYGSPWTLNFCNWAFNKSEEDIKLIWDQIPKNIDILLLHSPPYAIGDFLRTESTQKRIGSKTLRDRVFEVQPKYVVFGHNHGGHGEYEEKGIKFINASILDDNYYPAYKPIVFEI